MKFTKNHCWIVIAAHNERGHIGDVILRSRKQGFRNIVVVDDGSQDDTQRIAQQKGAIALRHIVNLGKGAAMKTGADYAISRGAKALIFMDGDGQHKPEELGRFLSSLNRGYAIVFGARKRTEHMPLVLRLGNWFITTVVRVFYNLRLRDVLSGYRAMTADAYRCVRWVSRDYSVESEMIARAGKNNLRYAEFEIATIYHDKYKGTTFLDGFPIVFNLIWWRMTH